MISYVLAYMEFIVATGLFFYLNQQYEIDPTTLAGLFIATVYGISAVLWMHYRKDREGKQDIILPIMGFLTILQAYFLKETLFGWYLYVLIYIMSVFVFKKWLNRKNVLKMLLVVVPVLLLMLSQIYLIFYELPKQGGLLEGQIWHNFDVVKSIVEGMTLRSEYLFILSTLLMVMVAFGIFPFSWLKDKDYLIAGPAFGYVGYMFLYKLLINTYYALPDNLAHLSILFIMVFGALVIMSFSISRFYSVYALVPIYSISLTTGKIDFEGFFLWAFFLFIMAISITPTMDKRWALWHLAGGPLGVSFWGIWLIMLSLYGIGFHLDWWLMLLFWIGFATEFTRLSIQDIHITDEMVLKWVRDSSFSKILLSSIPGLALSFLSIFVGWWGLNVVNFARSPVRPYNISLLAIKLPFGDVNTPVSALVILNMVVVALMWLSIWYWIWESLKEKEVDMKEMAGDENE